ncbi:MAG: alpha/beta hydrolase family protein [Candidatus Kariarchaeaceae archaeon]|jgi:esterase/lipase
MQSRTLDHEVFSNVSHLIFEPDDEADALVIRMHGLPGRSPDKEGPLLGKFLTDKNIAFFAFDFPGIRETKGYYTYRNAYTLAKSVLEYFANEHEEIYPNIGIYGESFGGSISVSLSNSSPSISALFLWSPVLNFKELSKEIELQHIIKFMEDSGAIRLPIYDDFAQAFTTQLELNPPERAHNIFDKIPVKIVTSDSDLLFPPFVLKKQLDVKYHDILDRQDNLDHNLNKFGASLKLSTLAGEFFHEHLV